MGDATVLCFGKRYGVVRRAGIHRGLVELPFVMLCRARLFLGLVLAFVWDGALWDLACWFENMPRLDSVLEGGLMGMVEELDIAWLLLTTYIVV